MDIAMERDQPSDEWIATLGRRFPVERKVAEALDNKLRIRRGPEYKPRQASDLHEDLKAFLHKHVEGAFELKNLARLPGGGSGASARRRFQGAVHFRSGAEGRDETPDPAHEPW